MRSASSHATGSGVGGVVSELIRTPYCWRGYLAATTLIR